MSSKTFNSNIAPFIASFQKDLPICTQASNTPPYPHHNSKIPWNQFWWATWLKFPFLFHQWFWEKSTFDGACVDTMLQFLISSLGIKDFCSYHWPVSCLVPSFFLLIGTITSRLKRMLRNLWLYHNQSSMTGNKRSIIGIKKGFLGGYWNYLSIFLFLIFELSFLKHQMNSSMSKNTRITWYAMIKVVGSCLRFLFY